MKACDRWRCTLSLAVLMSICMSMNRKTIVVLYGRGNVGKTSTLRILSDILLGLPVSYSPDDVRLVCYYRGLKVAIATWGDNEDEVVHNINFFREHNADIGITAARTYGRTHAAIENYADEVGAKIVWMKKYWEDGDMRAINHKYADRIMGEIAKAAQ